MNMAAWVNAVADEHDVPLLKMDGYDDCIAGIVRRFNDSFVVYDKAKVLQKLEDNGMASEEADEWYEFNMVSAWVGDATVGFLEKPE